jgi:adenylate cyclase
MRRAPRRLIVLASLDVAGFTRLVERDERGTLLELAQIRRHVLRKTVANHGGNLFKTMGDGALVEFNSVEEGVEWAIDFQTLMAEHNHGRPNPILVRVGVSLADVFVQGNDRFGAAVGFVTGVQKVAPPGGIAITHSVRWQLVKPLADQFDRTEWFEFKNVDEQYELWLWRKPGDAPAANRFVGIGHRPNPPAAVPKLEEARPASLLPSPPAPPPASDMPSVVVLAFDNMSGDPVAGALADGIVEEITATLSRVRDFTVIARNSAYAYRGRAIDVRDIARELGVRYVLEGSLRKAGDRVRITAQLIDAASGAHIWADSYDGVVENVFDFEDEIAERVAGALHPSIRAAEIVLAKRKHPENLAAYDLVLRALPHLWAHRREDNAEAIRLLDDAMGRDPAYARAAAVAAWARAQHVVYNWSTDFEQQRREGAALIERAANTADDDPTALCALSTAVMLLHGDLGRAQHFVDRALSLDPNHAWAWTRRGFLRVYSGDPTTAIACFERAANLSPLDPFSFNSFIGIGLANFSLGRPDDAAQWTLRAMREKVGMTWAYRDLAAFLAHAGRIPEAREAMAKLIASRPYLTVKGVADALAFMEPALLKRYLEGLKMAGLPD